MLVFFLFFEIHSFVFYLVAKIIMFWFYFFCIVILYFALNIIISKNSVKSVLSLICIFVGAALLLLFLGLDYLSLIFISIYIGALSILFLFVIMMLNIKIFTESGDMLFYLLFFGIIFFFSLIEYTKFFFDIHLYCDDLITTFNNSLILKKNIIITIGTYLFTQFFIYFIVVSFVLFIAMLGSIALVFEPYVIIKNQLIYQQVSRLFSNSYLKIK